MDGPTVWSDGPRNKNDPERMDDRASMPTYKSSILQIMFPKTCTETFNDQEVWKTNSEESKSCKNIIRVFPIQDLRLMRQLSNIKQQFFMDIHGNVQENNRRANIILGHTCSMVRQIKLLVCQCPLSLKQIGCH